ncbi:MAG: exopolysaccharide biosynthesis protein [Verrucomicrobiae bacterium]|nr:exopolysaccharide biosynthesis protein [Verrucomicrobiae bacterium]
MPEPRNTQSRLKRVIELARQEAEANKAHHLLSQQLGMLEAEIDKDSLSLGELLQAMHGRGFLALMVIICLPFLQPVGVPALSMFFGAIIAITGAKLAVGQKPWLPETILNRSIPANIARHLLRTGVALFSKVEKLLKPRLPFVSHSIFGRINGACLLINGILLMLPLPPFPPLTNMLPAWAVVLLALGMMEKDGYFIISGYITTLVSAVYIGVILLAGAWVFSHFKPLLDWVQGLF